MNRKKKLKDMTLEELWELFPIVLTTYQPQWKEWATKEIESLHKILSEFSPVINHIGSTAIPGIWAKPTIDVLVEIAADCNWDKVKSIMESAEYVCMSSREGRMSFNKGYTSDGYAEKVFHIHFHVAGDDDEVYFRNYLITHPEIATEYEKLKLSLLPKYRNNRDGYTEAKAEFIENVVKLGKSSIK